jgi:glycerol-3-phosphate dehydrogenase
MKEFSVQTRSENLVKLRTEKFDLLIIGGGITGAGVARDAALRGLKVALVEGHDFAFGTSSRSSKMIHGGIRYLENKEFHLVFEALNERTKLFGIAPHLVHPLRFMIPLFKNSRVGMFKMGLGMWLYDALALFQAPELHERLNPAETRERMPILVEKELRGSYVYSDAYMDDDRLVHETLRAANEAGAVCVNYVKALKSNFSEDAKEIKVRSITVKDMISNSEFSIEAKHVISSVGPWTDLVGDKLVDNWKKILRPTKGVHLTFRRDRINLSCGVVMGAEKSDRIVFAIPRHDMVIIGTTDTDFLGSPENAKVTEDDIKYLLEVTNNYFPGSQLTAKDIVASYVGVRPLVHDDSGTEGKTSREHAIIHDPRGFTFVAGGKYTTYRLMSEQIVDQACKFLPFELTARLNKCETVRPLNPMVDPETFESAVANASSDLEKKLALRYGAEAKPILLKYGFSENIWVIEAHQAIHQTMCLNLTDFYTRRVPLMLSEIDHGLSFLNEISEVFEIELGLTKAQINDQKLNLQSYIGEELGWKKYF